MEKSNKVRVLHILWSFGNGGMENIVKNMIINETSTTNSFLVIINNDIDMNALNKISSNKIYKVNRKRRSWNFLKIIKLFWVIVNVKPHILHLHYYNLIKLIKPLQYFLSFKIIATIHGMNDFNKSIEKADKIVAVSNTHLEYIIKKCKSENILHQNLHMIYNGINIPEIRNNKLELNPPLKIFVVGRLNHLQKKQDFIIDSFSKFLKDGNVALLSFFGSGSSEAYLKNKCKELEIYDKVTFEGSVENRNLLERIKNYDVMISASENETFGINIIESLALGIPVISYPAPTLIEITKGNPLAIFYKDKEHLISLLKKLPANINKESVLKSQKIIKNNYSIEKMIENYREIYLEIK